MPAYLQPVLGVLVLVDVDLGLDQLEDLNCRCAGIRLYLLIMFPTAKFQTEFILSFGAFFVIFWPDKSLTLRRISEVNFGLDQLEDLYLLLIFPTTTYKAPLKQNWSCLFLAFFDIYWPDKSLTLCGISEANFGLDQLKDLICSCAGIKLYGVELAIHEVESSIDGPSVDRTQDLLFGGWPLSSPCSKCLVKTLKVRIQYAL